MGFKHNLISRENSICVYTYTQIHETVQKKRAGWSEYYYLEAPAMPQYTRKC